ncbi:MAG: ABC transporter ATP-binding protein [Desulfarculales bacterium]|nr:ABC transporter ATP-binding protein [Desulfarculales bacterium]
MAVDGYPEPAAPPPLLSAEGIAYRHKKQDILTDISLNLRPGQIKALVGPNGAGKTTLLRCLSGYFSPSQGQVKLRANGDREKTRLLAYMPQQAPPSVALSVAQAVLLGRRPYLGLTVRPADISAVGQALARLDLSALADKAIDRISAGEYQLVMLARTLAQGTACLLLDEPLSNLDPAHQIRVLNLLRDLALHENKAILLSLHDLALVSRFAHRVILLAGGRILAAGEPAKVLTGEHLRKAYGIEMAIHTLPQGGMAFAPIT